MSILQDLFSSSESVFYKNLLFVLQSFSPNDNFVSFKKGFENFLKFQFNPPFSRITLNREKHILYNKRNSVCSKSDHSQFSSNCMVLVYKTKKTFSFENSWLLEDELVDVVKHGWLNSFDYLMEEKSNLILLK